MELKYGCNPHQIPARLTFDGSVSPLQVLNGTPGYINLLDALNAWQLARDLKRATGKSGAASFKHVSPAGAAVAGRLDDAYRQSQFLGDEEFSDVASAYIRARGGDRLCSYGDVAAVSDRVDLSLARFLKTEVCDLIIAPSYEPEALEILRAKKGGAFIILVIDPDFEPDEVETRSLFGFTLEQRRNDAVIGPELFRNLTSARQDLSTAEIETLVVATVALKYTQSNSVGVAWDGQVIGMGAGQQSRVHCTRLACGKADKWMLQQHPALLSVPWPEGMKKTEKINLIDQLLLWDELSDQERTNLDKVLKGFRFELSAADRRAWFGQFAGLCLSSDAFIPFRDNIDRAHRSGIRCVAHAGQALRNDDVTQAINEYGMVEVQTGLRLFTH